MASNETGGPATAAGLVGLARDRRARTRRAARPARAIESEYVRAWAVQLLCEAAIRTTEALGRVCACSPKGDPSPVVRLYLASALQRLPSRGRLVDRRAGYWATRRTRPTPTCRSCTGTAIEPLVAADPARDAVLAVGPRSRSSGGTSPGGSSTSANPARRQEATSGRGSRHSVRRRTRCASDCSTGPRGTRGRKASRARPAGLLVSATCSRSKDPAIREQATALALIVRRPAPRWPTCERVQSHDASLPRQRTSAALEALIEHAGRKLARVLHECLDDKALRPTALRGLAAYDDPATPKLVLGLYPKLDRRARSRRPSPPSPRGPATPSPCSTRSRRRPSRGRTCPPTPPGRCTPSATAG